MTKLDTTVAFLEESAIWDDMDRANDITYYEVTAWGRVGVRVRRACPDPPGEG